MAADPSQIPSVPSSAHTRMPGQTEAPPRSRTQSEAPRGSLDHIPHPAAVPQIDRGMSVPSPHRQNSGLPFRGPRSLKESEGRRGTNLHLRGTDTGREGPTDVSDATAGLGETLRSPSPPGTAVRVIRGPPASCIGSVSIPVGPEWGTRRRQQHQPQSSAVEGPRRSSAHPSHRLGVETFGGGLDGLDDLVSEIPKQISDTALISPAHAHKGGTRRGGMPSQQQQQQQHNEGSEEEPLYFQQEQQQQQRCEVVGVGEEAIWPRLEIEPSRSRSLDTPGGQPATGEGRRSSADARGGVRGPTEAATTRASGSSGHYAGAGVSGPSRSTTNGAPPNHLGRFASAATQQQQQRQQQVQVLSPPVSFTSGDWGKTGAGGGGGAVGGLREGGGDERGGAGEDEATRDGAEMQMRREGEGREERRKTRRPNRGNSVIIHGERGNGTDEESERESEEEGGDGERGCVEGTAREGHVGADGDGGKGETTVQEGGSSGALGVSSGCDSLGLSRRESDRVGGGDGEEAETERTAANGPGGDRGWKQELAGGG
uniref:Uncharacterized protein n=1 Tax=Chromera velia CCMP2878 TaxID=1169474 RepID=A0A0G4FK26_9ALVE|eukprot:Cvel_17425.t1-p1 / transcript=Cvel_17425.t1 / gene=Cvel_17425 / organism=Chromera_velia_CCMP2878 / gene_product=hypothetical protein / transcript_product=hypothetical protein / location=Cvel_scaffold1389:3177-5292(-) / protein_length=541 / sequence_SO=supercontig / SO=protein_coding / is_pseudo=false